MDADCKLGRHHYFALVKERVETSTGESFIHVLFCACCGDIRPVDRPLTVAEKCLS